MAAPQKRNIIPISTSNGYMALPQFFDRGGQEWPLQKPDLTTSVTPGVTTTTASVEKRLGVEDADRGIRRAQIG